MKHNPAILPACIGLTQERVSNAPHDRFANFISASFAREWGVFNSRDQ